MARGYLGDAEGRKKISPTRFELVTLRLSNYSLTLFQLSYGEDIMTPSRRSMFRRSRSFRLLSTRWTIASAHRGELVRGQGLSREQPNFEIDRCIDREVLYTGCRLNSTWAKAERGCHGRWRNYERTETRLSHNICAGPRCSLFLPHPMPSATVISALVSHPPAPNEDTRISLPP